MATREMSKASISVGNKDAAVAPTHQPEYIGNSLVNFGTNGTSITLDVPAGTSAGDLLIVVIVTGLTGSDRVNHLTGWVFRERTQSTTVFTRVYDGVDSSYTFTLSTASPRTGVLLSFRKSTIQTSVNSVFGSSSTTDVVAPAVTINYSPCLLIGVIASTTATQTFSTPSGWTQRVAQQTNDTLYVFTKDALQATGDTGTLTFTKTVGTNSCVAGQIGIYGI